MTFLFSRRRALQVVGSVAVASALKSFRAEAQMAAIPKRVVFFFTPHGTIFENWRPSGTVNDFTLPYILEPLAPFRNRIAVLDGMGFKSGGPGAPHTRGPAVLFTGSPLADDGTFERSDCSGGCSFGWNTHHSVDQELAQRLQSSMPYGSLEFGVLSGGGFPGAHISYQAPGKPVPPRQNPRTAFQQLFGDRRLSEEERVRELNRRLDILATVQEDLTAVRGKVALDDFRRLESHAEALSSLQRSLGASLASCTLPAEPAAMSTSDPNYRPWAIDRQSELIAASLACGLSRVASLQWRVGENDGGASGLYSWLGHTSEHHLTSHDTSPEAKTRLSQIYRWYSERFAYLLQQLDSFPEADGTLLDHTLVVWGSELGDGYSHSIKNVPFVLAGGNKAGARMGQYLKFPSPVLHNRLLVSICHYMGYTDVQKFGTFDDGLGPISELFG